MKKTIINTIVITLIVLFILGFFWVALKLMGGALNHIM